MRLVFNNYEYLHYRTKNIRYFIPGLLNEEKGIYLENLITGEVSEKLKTIKDKYGYVGVYNYYNIKKSAGKNSVSALIPTLQMYDIPDAEKGSYVEAVATKLAAGAKNAKAIYGNEGVYQYYLHKQLADADKSGQLSKSEIEQYLAYQQMADEMKRTWERLLSN